MAVILLASPKGGVGKSSLCVNLAGTLAAAGRRVVLIDADPQGTALVWARQRERTTRARRAEGVPVPAPVEAVEARGAPDQAVRDAARRAEYVVVDSPAGDRSALAALFRVADAVIAPFQPSPVDLLSAVLLDDRLTAAGMGGRAVLVLNRASPMGLAGQEREAREAVRGLWLKSLRLADTAVCERVSFRRSFMAGLSVGEAGTDPKAAAEIDAVLHSIGLNPS